jgi:CubicO group peptidase (beta-lactamase class C family)
MTEIRGSVEPGYEGVRDAFEANFAEHGEVGAGFCLYVDGQPVVELTGGVVDPGGRPYDDTTLQMVFSTTKGMTAACAHLLAQRGDLDLDAPVTDYWPEFAAAGKADVPVSWLLCHKSGVIDTDARLTLDEALDWNTVTAALAASTPVWEPGTAHGYHAVTYGWLVGEIVRRVSGQDIGTFLREEVATPLGLDMWIGLPDDQQDRVAPLVPFSTGGLDQVVGGGGEGGGAGAGSDSSPAGPSSLVDLLNTFLGEGNLAAKALTAPGGAFADEHVWNEPAVRASQIPAANGVTNAPSLARFYASLVSEVDGFRLLDETTVKRATTVQVDGPDRVLFFPLPFALGFMTHSTYSPFVGGSSFGHYGAGGSVGFADPDRRIAGGYVMNQMQLGIAGDPRTAGLLEAVDRAVG